MSKRWKILLLTLMLVLIPCVLVACGHKDPVSVTYFEGNCQRKGYTRKFYADGSYEDEEDVYFGPHAFTKFISETPASCAEEGKTVYECTVCGEQSVTTTPKTENHNYVRTVTKKATCLEEGEATFTCSICKDSYSAKTEKANHNYKETINKQPSCTEEGKATYTCSVCKDSYEAKLEKTEHDSRLIRRTAATCTVYAVNTYRCNDCGYTYTEADTASGYAAHKYEAYVCRVCDADMLLEYYEYFAAHGNSISDAIQIANETQLTLLFDYIYFNRMTTEVWFTLNYTFYASSMNEYIQNRMQTHTSGSFLYYGMNTRDGSVTASVKIMDDYGLTAKYAPDTMYEEAFESVIKDASGIPIKSAPFVYYDSETYDEAHSLAYCDYTSTRSETFDEFKYLERTHEVAVTSSDQLFYAFSHGYKPLPTAGSDAERILRKAKEVAREIMDDTMSDVDKVRAIYLWLTKNVSYDNGLVSGPATTTYDWYIFASYYLEGVFDNGIAVCDGISKAFCVLAGLEDIKCVQITGDAVQGSSTIGHAWNKVYIDANGDGRKTWYVTDATWANQSYQSYASVASPYVEGVDIAYFLFTDAERTAQGATGSNYGNTDCTANTGVNVYELMYYSAEHTSESDFYIESRTELSAILVTIETYFSSQTDTSGILVTLFISEEYCSYSNMIAGEILEVYGNAGYYHVETSEKITYSGKSGFVVYYVFYSA